MNNNESNAYLDFLKSLPDAVLDVVVEGLRQLQGLAAHPDADPALLGILNGDKKQYELASYVQAQRKDARPPVFVPPYGDSVVDKWISGEGFTNAFQIFAAKAGYHAGFDYGIWSVQQALDAKGINVKLTIDPIPVEPPVSPVTPAS